MLKQTGFGGEMRRSLEQRGEVYMERKQNTGILVRSALREELARVNEIRRFVNDVHVQGRPDIFRPGFAPELGQHVYDCFEKENWNVLVAVLDGEICGFATVEYLDKPESPYSRARKMYHVEEFGVDPAYHRRGAASALVDYMRQDARERGFEKLELDMWEFNTGALAFYEAAGFTTYRRYMELKL